MSIETPVFSSFGIYLIAEVGSDVVVVVAVII